MFSFSKYINHFQNVFPEQEETLPWKMIAGIENIISKMILLLDENYITINNIAIHKSAKVEDTAIIKSPTIIAANAFVGSYSLLRGGVFVGEHSTVGTHCEIKSSIIFNHSALAHFNFVGDSIIGNYVNMEAGSAVANHFNERKEKEIYVWLTNEIINTHSLKFGSLIADNTKIGANAVLCPGTILAKNSIVKRLELVEQLPLIKSSS